MKEMNPTRYVLLFFFIFCYSLVSFSKGTVSDSLLLIYINTTNDSTRLHELKNIADYWIEKNSDSCIFYSKKLIREAVDAWDYELTFYTFYMVMDQFNSSGMYDSSLYFLFKGLEYFRNNRPDPFKQAEILSLIGEQYRATGKYDNAIHYLQEAWDIDQHLGNLELKSITSNRFAAVYFEMEQYDKSLMWVDSSLVLSYLLNDSHLIANNLNIKGAINRGKGDYVQSLKTLQDALIYTSKSSDSTMLAEVYNNIAVTYYSLNNYDSTIKFAQQSYTISSSANIHALTVVSSLYLAFGYEKIKKFEAAYKYYRIYEQTQNKLFHEERDKIISELNTKYETQKKEQQILMQTALLEKKDLKIRQNRIVGFLFLIIFLSLIAFSIYIFTTRKKLKKTNQHLSEKNLQINEQKTKIETYAKKVDDDYKKLQELDEYKEAMTNMLVHDLKNPLNMLANLDVFANESEKNNIINRSSKQMLNLIMNILDINKAENNSLTLDKTNVDLIEIIKLALKETEFLCLQKNIKIFNKSEFNYSFMADKEILIRVFINLLTNAIKHSSSNSSIIINTLIIPGNLLRVSLKDDGTGIAKEHHKMIFEKFTQVNKDKSRQNGSTGLGLAFCKIAIEAHNWEIGVESESGKGAEFRIIINDFQKTVNTSALSENNDKMESEIAEREISVNDRRKLKPYFLELKKLDVYRISEIKKIISDIGNETSIEIKPWLNEVMKAAEFCNETKYNDLLEEGCSWLQ